MSRRSASKPYEGRGSASKPHEWRGSASKPAGEDGVLGLLVREGEAILGSKLLSGQQEGVRDLVQGHIVTSCNNILWQTYTVYNAEIFQLL